MKIVIPGGSGQVGQVLARAFLKDGHDVVILTRQPAVKAVGRSVFWDGRTLGDWTGEFETADVVINLAGKSVNCRYTPGNREEITRSRVDSTKVVGQGIARAECPPRLWLQAATATIYSHLYDAPNDEASGIIGGHEENVPETWRFSIDVANAWERAFHEAPLSPRTRKVLLRSAVILSPDRGGIFDVLLGLVRHGLGGQVGDGRQFMSWIHDTDFIRAIYWLITHENLEGAVILASPNPLPNAEFMRVLREAWGTRVGLPASKWMLEIATFFMRTETELILKSRRVVPGRLLQDGFKFQFADWPDAARDLCRRWRLM
ncbi:MAG TPA: TIGR01777 family oxidoreductase [Chthoniobacterales bacterium]|nr:TIGR01777 family oxidoreductase [Chthoniobacterales bacterium]